MFTFLFYLWLNAVFNGSFCATEQAAVKTSSPVYTSLSKEEAFARKVFDCLKANDKKAWLALYPTAGEYKALLQKMVTMKRNGLTKAEADEMAARQQKEAAQLYANDFDALQREAKAVGLPWFKVVYTGFEFEAGASPVGNRYTQGDVWLKAGKTEYVIEKVEAIETAGGYRLQNVAAIKRIDTGE